MRTDSPYDLEESTNNYSEKVYLVMLPIPHESKGVTFVPANAEGANPYLSEVDYFYGNEEGTFVRMGTRTALVYEPEYVAFPPGWRFATEEDENNGLTHGRSWGMILY